MKEMKTDDDMLDVHVLLDVSPSAGDTYINNYRILTSNADRVMLMAGDQKVEQLNDDFAVARSNDNILKPM